MRICYVFNMITYLVLLQYQLAGDKKRREEERSVQGWFAEEKP